MVVSKSAEAAKAVSAGEFLRPEHVHVGSRYRRLDGRCSADVLAVNPDRVLIVARWGRFQWNCLHLGLADFCARYSI